MYQKQLQLVSNVYKNLYCPPCLYFHLDSIVAWKCTIKGVITFHLHITCRLSASFL